MLSSKFRTRQFGPNPMDYMKHKIERLREDLLVEELRPVEVDEVSEQEPSQFTSSGDEAADHADDEFSSEAGASDLLSRPGTPLILPLHKGDVTGWTISSSSSTLSLSKAYLFFQQPVTLLLLASAVFIPASSALAILDRFNMYQATYKFPFPLTHFFCQLVFSELILLVWTLLSSQIVRFQPLWRGRIGLIEDVTWDLSTAKSLAPVSITFLFAGAAFTCCLEYVPMDFALLFISPMLLFQLALSKFFSPECTQSKYIALASIMLMIGHTLASLSYLTPGMPEFNMQGLVTGVFTSLALPIHNCLVKKHLPRLNYHSMQLLHYILINAIVMMLPLLFISGEVMEISANCFFLDEAGFWLMMLLLCVVGVLTCISQFILLVITSPLTVVVLIFAKTAIIQVPIAKLLNKSSLSMLNVLGLVICIFSTGIYLYLLNLHRPKFGLKWQTA